MKNKNVLMSLMLLLTMAATACGGNNGGQGGGSADGFVFDNDELETAQKIHTTDQSNYLKFREEQEGNSYYQMNGTHLDKYHASGRQNASAPEKITLKWDYEVPSDKELSKFVVTFGQEQDLSDGFVVNGTKQNQISF